MDTIASARTRTCALIAPLRLAVPLLVTGITAVAPFAGFAADWPQYRGPQHDGRTPESITRRWPQDGLRTVWKLPTTRGFSVFSVAQGRAFTLMTRTLEGAPQEVCVALDANTGKELWAAPLGPAKYDGGGDSGAGDNKGGDGPRSTPTVHRDRVFILDARLVLTCLDFATGKTVWQIDLVKTHHARNITWQNAASPVIDNDLIYLCSGADGASLMALSPTDGAVVWKTESDKMTHASPVPATLHGVRQMIFFTQKGLVATEAKTGKVLWRHPFRFSTSTAASPIVSGDLVYCSAGYGVGSGVVRIGRNGDAFEATEVWRITENQLANHWSTPVLKDGHLYGLFGFKEYGKCPLKCVELATGKEKWAAPGFGPGGVVLAGDLLLALNDHGELVLVDPNPAQYKELARMKAIAGKCWNHPTVAGGRIFARSTTEGVCLEAAPTPP